MRYRLAVRTTITTINLFPWDLVSGAGVKGRLLSLNVALASAVASQLSLLRGLTQGTRTTPTVYQPEPFGPVNALSSSAIAFSANPTITAGQPTLARMTFPATIGVSYFFDFGPSGLELPANSAAAGNLLLQNIVAGGVFDVTAVIDE